MTNEELARRKIKIRNSCTMLIIKCPFCNKSEMYAYSITYESNKRKDLTSYIETHCIFCGERFDVQLTFGLIHGDPENDK